MRAIQVRQFGGPDVLELVELARPQPAEGEAVIQVDAVDVLALDLAVRRGEGIDYFAIAPPYVPGDGAAGRVVAVGSDVGSHLVGQRVAATTGVQGAYADRVAVSADDLIAIPDDLDSTAAAALVHDGRTALALIEAAAIRPGDRVLIVPAGSGLGVLLVQLARLAGGVVLAAARGDGRLAAAKEVGAHQVIDCSTQAWTAPLVAEAAAMADVVFDGVGGDTGRAAFQATAPGGRYLAFSGEAGPSGHEARQRGVAMHGTEVVHLGSSGAARRLTEQVLADAAARRLHPVIGQTYPLERAADAHTAFENGGLVGRTLITGAVPRARSDEDELAALVTRFCQGFAVPDVDLLEGLWADEDDLVYIAGERSRPLRTRDEIAEYYRAALGPVDAVQHAAVSELRVKAGKDLGYTSFRFQYSGREAVEGHRFDVDIRASAVARRRGSSWQLVLYHESTPGPL